MLGLPMLFIPHPIPLKRQEVTPLVQDAARPLVVGIVARHLLTYNALIHWWGDGEMLSALTAARLTEVPHQPPHHPSVTFRRSLTIGMVSANTSV